MKKIFVITAFIKGYNARRFTLNSPNGQALTPADLYMYLASIMVRTQAFKKQLHLNKNINAAVKFIHENATFYIVAI
jgi:hypothetical protein